MIVLQNVNRKKVRNVTFALTFSVCFPLNSINPVLHAFVM